MPRPSSRPILFGQWATRPRGPSPFSAPPRLSCLVSRLGPSPSRGQGHRSYRPLPDSLASSLHSAHPLLGQVCMPKHPLLGPVSSRSPRLFTRPILLSAKSAFQRILLVSTGPSLLPRLFTRPIPFSAPLCLARLGSARLGPSPSRDRGRANARLGPPRLACLASPHGPPSSRALCSPSARFAGPSPISSRLFCLASRLRVTRPILFSASRQRILASAPARPHSSCFASPLGPSILASRSPRGRPLLVPPPRLFCLASSHRDPAQVPLGHLRPCHSILFKSSAPLRLSCLASPPRSAHPLRLLSSTYGPAVRVSGLSIFFATPRGPPSSFLSPRPPPSEGEGWGPRGPISLAPPLSLSLSPLSKK